MKNIILYNHRITIRDVSDDIGIWFDSFQIIFTKVLDMQPAAKPIVLKLLNFEQKQRQMDIAQNMWTTFNADPELFTRVMKEIIWLLINKCNLFKRI